MYWANVLHIYQPPTQTEDIVRRVADESYRKIVSILEGAPGAKITLNMTACLTDQLYRYGLSDIIDGIGRLAERGQVELTGTAMFHPILPMLSTDEVRRQIQLNEINNRRYFGEVFKPKGFFPPEMCYSFEVADIAAAFGYQWIIMDEIGFNGRLGQARKDVIYQLHGLKGFDVFFSDRSFSAGLTYGAFPTGKEFKRALRRQAANHAYLLTATDGEIYGHHRPGQEDLLRQVFAAQTPKTATVSELLDLFTARETAYPLPSSWSTWEDEMADLAPYPQWNYPDNHIHELQWQLTFLTLDLLELLPAESDNYAEARSVMDEALHSCQYWWASCRPWWNAAMIDRGVELLSRVIALAERQLPSEKVARARELADGIIRETQLWQSSGKAHRLQQQYLADHPQVSTTLTFGTGGVRRS